MVLRRFFIALSINPRAQSFVLHNGLARRASRRFIAGETLEEGIEAVRAVNRLGIHASLNYLGEKTTNPALAESAAGMYIRTLEAIHSAGLDCNLSIKLSQLGLAIEESLAESHLRRILEVARRHNLFVRIDMEESPFVEQTLRIWRRMRAEGFSNVGVVIQAYLYRSASDVEALVKEGARIRLVKGAYLEPPSVAFPRKRDVDENYRRLMEFLLRSGDYPAIATHDEKLITHAKAFATREGIPPSQFEFQMIYGVRRDLQRSLAQEGYNVRVYIPFGEQWYPYFMRRLAERPANVLFLLRSVLAERA